MNITLLCFVDRVEYAHNMGVGYIGQDVVIFSISNMAAVVRAGQALLNFWLLSCTLVFQSASVQGLDQQ